MKNLWTIWIAGCLALAGCDTDDTDSTVTSDVTGPSMGMESGDAGMSTMVNPDATEAVEDGSYCEMNPATEDNSFCASVVMPEDAAGIPEKVSFHFFESLPPAGPPSLMGLELANASDMEMFQPGAEVPMVIENLPSEGSYYIYAAVYMEGGGASTWIIVPGVDYEGDLPDQEALEFTGAPINVNEPITLKFAE